MGQNRSADPWSTFLGSAERSGGAQAGRWTGPSADERGTAPGHAVDASDRSATEPSEFGERVLDALAEESDPVPVERLHERLGLSLLEVADAVRELDRAGLVEVVRSGMDDLIRATGRDRRPGAGRPQ